MMVFLTLLVAQGCNLFVSFDETPAPCDADGDSDGDGDGDADADSDVDECEPDESVATCDSSSCNECVDENCDGVFESNILDSRSQMSIGHYPAVGPSSYCVNACSAISHVCVEFVCALENGSHVTSREISTCEPEVPVECGGGSYWSTSIELATPGLWTCFAYFEEELPCTYEILFQLAFACGQVVVPSL